MIQSTVLYFQRPDQADWEEGIIILLFLKCPGLPEEVIKTIQSHSSRLQMLHGFLTIQKNIVPLRCMGGGRTDPKRADSASHAPYQT